MLRTKLTMYYLVGRQKACVEMNIYSHQSSAKRESFAHFLFRMSWFITVNSWIDSVDRFRHVIECGNNLIAAGMNKSLKDCNGKTAAELADEVGEYRLRDLFAPGEEPGASAHVKNEPGASAHVKKEPDMA